MKYNVLNPPNSQRGLTLIELLMTMLIMVIALFALSALKNSTLRSTISAQRVTESTACAEERIETLIDQGYSKIPNGTNIGTCPDDRFQWETTVSDVDSVDKMKRIQVLVEWSSGSVSLQTLLGDI